MSYKSDAERHEVYLARLATGLLNAHVYPSLDEALKAARRILAERDQINTNDQLINIIQKLDKQMIKPLDEGWALATAGLTAPTSGALGSSTGIVGAMPVGSALTGTGAGAATAPVTNVLGYAAGTPGYLSNTQLGVIGWLSVPILVM